MPTLSLGGQTLATQTGSDAPVLGSVTLNSNQAFPADMYIGNMKYYQTTSVHEITSSATSNLLVDIDPFRGDENGSWIQPKFATSRIWFECQLNCGHETTWRGNRFLFYYKIGSDSFQSTHFFACSSLVYNANAHGTTMTMRGGFLMPNLNTTEKVYIKMHHDGHDNGPALHLNQNNSTNSNSGTNQFSMPSWIMLREIAQ